MTLFRIRTASEDHALRGGIDRQRPEAQACHWELAGVGAEIESVCTTSDRVQDLRYDATATVEWDSLNKEAVAQEVDQCITCHTRTVPSPQPVAKKRESGEN